MHFERSFNEIKRDRVDDIDAQSTNRAIEFNEMRNVILRQSGYWKYMSLFLIIDLFDLICVIKKK